MFGGLPITSFTMASRHVSHLSSDGLQRDFGHVWSVQAATSFWTVCGRTSWILQWHLQKLSACSNPPCCHLCNTTTAWWRACVLPLAASVLGALQSLSNCMPADGSSVPFTSVHLFVHTVLLHGLLVFPKKTHYLLPIQPDPHGDRAPPDLDLTWSGMLFLEACYQRGV